MTAVGAQLQSYYPNIHIKAQRQEEQAALLNRAYLGYTHLNLHPQADFVVAGTTFFQTLAVTSAFDPSLVRVVTYVKTLPVTSTFDPVLTRVVTYVKTLAVTSEFTLTMIKLVKKSLDVVSTFTPEMVKKMFVTLAVSSAFTPVLTTVMTALRTLAVASGFVAAMTQQFIAGGVGRRIRAMTYIVIRKFINRRE